MTDQTGTPLPGGPQLIITMTPQGVQVSGPINDKVLCYGMLEAAKDAIREHMARSGSPNGLSVVRGRLKGMPGQN